MTSGYSLVLGVNSWNGTSLFESLLEQLLSLPASAVYAVVGSLAAIENIFPPVPADTAVALGAFLSHGGTVSVRVVFAVTWSANVGSAVVVYIAARKLGRPFFSGRIGRRLLNPRALAKLERLYDHHGVWGVFLSRFVPVARAVVPAFAGIAKLSAPRTIVPLATASAIWYGALTYLMATLAGQIEDVIRLVGRLNWVALVVTVIVVAWGIAMRIRVQRRQRRENRRTA